MGEKPRLQFTVIIAPTAGKQTARWLSEGDKLCLMVHTDTCDSCEGYAGFQAFREGTPMVMPLKGCDRGCLT